MDIIEHDEPVTDGPGFLVFDLPITLQRGVFKDKPIGEPKRANQPVLAVVDDQGAILVPDEALAWSNKLLRLGTATSQVRRKLNSIGRLAEFVATAVGDRISQPGILDLAVYEYLRARVENPQDPGSRVFEHWQPVTYETMMTEFRDIVDYARFCGEFTGAASPMSAAFKSSSNVWINVKRNVTGEDMLAHLEIHRARWQELRGEENPAPPTSLKKLALNLNATTSDMTTTLSVEEIERIIDCEKNLMFRAIWILLAYAGPRISEALQMWLCDVLDASYAPMLFGAPVTHPLVIFANPRTSSYTGSLDLKTSLVSRETFLMKRFGRKPRNDDSGSAGAVVGWKGMSTFNSRFKMSHGEWTSNERAAEFGLLVEEIRQLNARYQIGKRHPYLFFNLKSTAYFGEPQQLGNVADAFKRAVRRAGIEPDAPGAHLHGLRHFYKWFSQQELDLDPETVRRMMRQKNIDSQRPYGKRAEDVSNAMKKMRTRKNKETEGNEE